MFEKDKIEDFKKLIKVL